MALVLLLASLGGIGCELVVQVDSNDLPLPEKVDASMDAGADAASPDADAAAPTPEGNGDSAAANTDADTDQSSSLDGQD